MRHRLASGAATLARFAFALTVILIPFRLRYVLAARPLPPVYKDYTDFLLFSGDIFLLLTLACWGTGLALAPRRIRPGPLFITIPLLGLTAIGGISAMTSIDPALSVYHTIRLLLLALLYLFVVNEIRSPREVYVPVALQAVIQVIVGLGQFLQQHSIGLQSLGELELNPAWQGVSIVWTGTSVLLRAYGLSDHPNLLGGCLAFALVVIALAYIEAPEPWRGALATLFALDSLGLLLTFSRAAWLAAAGGIGLVFVYLLWTRQARAFSESVTLPVAASILLFPFVWQYAGYLGVRFNLNEPSMASGENRSVVERSALNDAAIRLIEGHAALGVGLGTFPLALRAAQPDFSFDYQPPHVAVLDVAAETGVFGGFLYGALLLAPWVALWRNRRRLRSGGGSSPDFHKPLALIAVSGLLLATTLIGLFDYYTWLLPAGQLWQWLTWGLWAAACQSWLEPHQAGSIVRK